MSYANSFRSAAFAARAGRMRGAVLVVALVFLALLTLIGVTAYSVATLEERMAGNARDRLRAFEAAEAALRHCESYLGGPIPPLFSVNGSTDPGMYDTPAIGATEKAETMDWASDPSRQMSGVAGVAQQPRCIVQRVARAGTPNPSLRAELSQPSVFAFQVTARGVGANVNSEVVLQSTFIRD